MRAMPAPARPGPPRSEAELLERARSLAGRGLLELARTLGVQPPRGARHAKGWAGTLLERALGATAGSRPEPDFPALGIELKTLPVRRDGRPLESTYVCVVPLRPEPGLSWQGSALRRKLDRVLWVPLLPAAEGATPGERHIGCPLLWSPSPEEETALRADWEELMELITLGRLDCITAHMGQCLQVRPKAADGRALTTGTAARGQPAEVLPRGFYLRPAFTAALLRRHYLLPG